jgi:hypothetical protein
MAGLAGGPTPSRMTQRRTGAGSPRFRTKSLFRVLNRTLIWISFIADQACTCSTIAKCSDVVFDALKRAERELTCKIIRRLPDCYFW